MDNISVSNARSNLFELIKNVNESHKPIQISNKNGKSAVLLSAEDWSSIEETLYLHSVPGLVASIIKGMDDPLDDMVSADDVEW